MVLVTTATSEAPRLVPPVMTAMRLVVALPRPTAMLTGKLPNHTTSPNLAITLRDASFYLYSFPNHRATREHYLTGFPNSVKDDNSSRNQDDDGAINPGSNLFVTGIHPKLSESEVTRLFEKYGEVEKCQIMKDPHTKESRGFGFVKMVTSDQADAAKDGLQGEVIEGRTLSIEKARRARPRTPTPGKYFGPPKRGKCLFHFLKLITTHQN